MQFRRFGFIALVICPFLFGQTTYAEPGVTTYVFKVQEERRSTRWTLTEWLRIKERMKLMDVWLAMFSSPKQDHFQPELNLVYSQTNGHMTLSGPSGVHEKDSLKGSEVKLQLWLTNLVTSTTGVKTLNIDFGLEGFQRSSGEFSPETDSLSLLATDPNTAGKRDLINRHATANFRLFGKNIQDSSLIFKVGQYQSFNNIAGVDEESDGRLLKGTILGGEMSLYLFKWLGVEGNYLDYGEARDSQNSPVKGAYYDYMAYIEVSLLRLMAGRYDEKWEIGQGADQQIIHEGGYIAGVKLQL